MASGFLDGRRKRWRDSRQYAREVAVFEARLGRGMPCPSPAPMVPMVRWGYAVGLKVVAVVGNHWVSRTVTGYITEQWNIAGQAHYSVMGWDGVVEVIAERCIRDVVSLAVSTPQGGQ